MTSTTDNTASSISAVDAPRTIVVEHTDGAPLSPDDPRVPFARTVATARAVVAEVGADNESNPTPCSEWDAGTMARHIVAILDRVTGAAEGEDLMAMPLIRDDVPVGDLVDALDGSAMALHETWSEPARLEQPMALPFGVLPGAVVMAVYSAEILTHTWDLATAIGVEPTWHEGDVAMATAVVRDGIPAEPRGGEMPFSPVATVADDAPPIHHLVTWLGRTV